MTNENNDGTASTENTNEDDKKVASPSTSSYGASNIKVLKGIEAVRKRPGMYIGDTSSYGLHHLVREVVDNSVDEHLATDATHQRGFCQNILLTVHQNNSITVIDDGRGIPVAMHPTEGKPALEVALTQLHAGGKFDASSYKVSGGLHGVGISVVNALSEWLEVEVYMGGMLYYQRYERGKKTCELEAKGKTSKQGTLIRFKPDGQIFPDRTFKYELLCKRFRDLAFLNAGLSLKISDDRSDRSDHFQYDGGIREFVKFMNANKDLVHKDVIYLSKDDEDGRPEIEVSFQYNDGFNENVMTFVNNIYTPDGGTHLVGFKTALTRAINNFAKKNNLLKNETPPTGDDLREGLSAVVSVKMFEPQFEGQTKTKLGSSEVQKKVETLVYEQLSNQAEEDPSTFKSIFNKGVLALRARVAAKKAKELARRKGALNSGSLPGKLSDCSSKDIASTELYVVEGDSAGGSAKQGRDRRFQAILPLKGKILNVEKARLDKMLNHEEIQILITAIGTGIGVDEFNLEKLRYGKIILMTDADVDGSHIRTLLLTFFFRHMRELIDKGHIYIAQPPLYKVKRKQFEEYVRSDKEMRNTLTRLGLDSCELRILDSEKRFSGDDLLKLTVSLEKLEDFGPVIRRHGIHFDRYLNQSNEAGELPTVRVVMNKVETLCYSEAELSEFIQNFTQTNEREAVLWESSDDFGEIDKADIQMYRIPEASELAAVAQELLALGFDVKDYASDLQDRYQLVVDDRIVSLSGIRNILPSIREEGQQGIEIQRYKGLGEMNPEQLWETTMDPEVRTLLRVTLPDAARADWLFNVLMGSMVEPRREYINKHALEVRNLDLV